MPDDCGSTTVSAIAVAIAASVALPPARRISRPASAARGSAAETAPGSATLGGDRRGGLIGASGEEKEREGEAAKGASHPVHLPPFA
jgi:hypothetical protein